MIDRVGIEPHYECAALPTELSRLTNEFKYSDVLSTRQYSYWSARKGLKRPYVRALSAALLPRQGVSP